MTGRCVRCLRRVASSQDLFPRRVAANCCFQRACRGQSYCCFSSLFSLLALSGIVSILPCFFSSVLSHSYFSTVIPSYSFLILPYPCYLCPSHHILPPSPPFVCRRQGTAPAPIHTSYNILLSQSEPEALRSEIQSRELVRWRRAGRGVAP